MTPQQQTAAYLFTLLTMASVLIVGLPNPWGILTALIATAVFLIVAKPPWSRR